MIHFHLNIEPQAWQRVKRNRQGKAYVPKETKEYEAAIKLMARKHRPPKPLEDALEVTIVFQIPKPKSVKRETPCVRPDIDNYGKAVLDALNGEFWKDDGQIVYLVLRKRYGLVPFVNVRIETPEDRHKREIEEKDWE